MVRFGGVVLCLLLVAMDVGAGILAIQAEVAQNKVKHLRLWIFECRDPSRDAFKLALGAAALLTLAHVLANLLGGCMCVCSQQEFHRSSANTQLSVACFIFTWIILVVGLSTLVIGILSNEKSKASCGLTHHHFLSIGGILCFVHGLFSVAYYVSATAASDEGK
ncbi:VASCULATURE COMPLEXITY AND CONNECTIVITY [Hibiscus trionum]|uniref:VASCULATURE COMPLEXITY AND CONNECTIVITY n=1 Tax=Hibiscus trionum TaxID=183268 RepID=A0A9W7HUR6_HIBTR|nr:VASCULATURE COMPLEXITY AND CONNECTIVITY [Hibiscus trionum]